MKKNDVQSSPDIFDAIKTRILKSCEQAEPIIAAAAAKFADEHRDDLERQERKFIEMSNRVSNSLRKRGSLRKTDEDAV